MLCLTYEIDWTLPVSQVVICLLWHWYLNLVIIKAWKWTGERCLKRHRKKIWISEISCDFSFYKIWKNCFILSKKLFCISKYSNFVIFSSFQSTLFLKEFLACNGCFGLFTKIKKGSGTSFWCTFAWFLHKNVPCLNVSNFQLYLKTATCRFLWIFQLKNWLVTHINCTSFNFFNHKTQNIFQLRK